MAGEHGVSAKGTAHEVGYGIRGAALFNHAGRFLMEIIRVSSRWFAHWPGASFYVPAPSLFTSGLYYLLLLCVCTAWILQPELRAWKIAAPLQTCFFCVARCFQRNWASGKLR
jgi:hypothetical protein